METPYICLEVSNAMVRLGLRSQKLATDMTKPEHQARKYMHYRSYGMKRLYRISPIHSYWQFCSSHMVLHPGILSSDILHIGCSSKIGMSPH
jgi:hypothetical protein